MRSGSIASNFLYSSLTTVLNVAVPLLTYPYITRVLGPDNLGRLGVAASLANYFIAAAGLGFATYGVRAVAKAAADSRHSAGSHGVQESHGARESHDAKSALARVASELGALALGASAVAATAYFAAILAVGRYRADLALFALFGLTIIASNAAVEWFFRGVERFRFIGLRNLVLQVVSVVFLFIIVRGPGDTVPYAALLAIVALLGAGLNLGAARRIVHLTFTGIRPLSHLAPMALFTLIAFSITAYTNLDFLFLGLASDPRQAGFYTVSIRLARMVTTVTATLSAVLLPRLSQLSSGDEEGFARILGQSARAIALFSLPAAAGIAVTADDLAVFFGGAGFAESAASLRILALLVPIVGASNFLQLQILVPRSRERAMLWSFGAGLAVTSLAMFLWVRPFGHIGAAWAMVAGEAAVLAVHAVLCLRLEPESLPRRFGLARYLAGTAITFLAALAVRAFLAPGPARLAAAVIAGCLAYAVTLVAGGDPMTRGLIQKAQPSGHHPGDPR